MNFYILVYTITDQLTDQLTDRMSSIKLSHDTEYTCDKKGTVTLVCSLKTENGNWFIMSIKNGTKINEIHLHSKNDHGLFSFIVDKDDKYKITATTETKGVLSRQVNLNIIFAPSILEIERPAEQPTERLAECPTEQPTERLAERPIEQPAAQPAISKGGIPISKSIICFYCGNKYVNGPYFKKQHLEKCAEESGKKLTDHIKCIYCNKKLMNDKKFTDTHLPECAKAHDYKTIL